MKNASLLRSVSEWVAGRFGCKIIPLWRLERRELATHLRKVFDLYDVQAVFDVGANRGQYRDFLRKEVKYDGAIHSFEPVATLYGALVERAAQDPAWTVYNCALGSEDGETTINVMRDSQFSSILAPLSSGLNDYDLQNRVVQTQPVALRRLDTMVAELPALESAQNVYLKIDTQGFDLEVLKGAPRTLARTVAMQSEVSVLPLYAGMPDYKTAIETFKARGFDVSGLFPIAHDQALRVVEFDCVMVNRLRIAAPSAPEQPPARSTTPPQHGIDASEGG